MTIFLPLKSSTPFPSTPSFLVASNDAQAQIRRVLKTILKARRIVVISGEYMRQFRVKAKHFLFIIGAGISVQAGIPDFRSPEGLFKTLKRDNPREALVSGKDLFDASVFNVSKD